MWWILSILIVMLIALVTYKIISKNTDKNNNKCAPAIKIDIDCKINEVHRLYQKIVVNNKFNKYIKHIRIKSILKDRIMGTIVLYRSINRGEYCEIESDFIGHAYQHSFSSEYDFSLFMGLRNYEDVKRRFFRLALIEVRIEYMDGSVDVFDKNISGVFETNLNWENDCENS